MKRIVRIIPLTIIATLFIAFAAPQKSKKTTIQFFEGTFKEALEASKTQNKPIFIDSYTASCRYCKKMDRTTFKNRGVVTYLNAHFINVKMNMRSEEGLKLKSKYHINALPTLLFVNSKGKSLVRVNGFIDTKTFLKKAKKAKRRFD